MIAWRISKARRAKDLSGIGAALEGGRWNETELPAVYMGLSAAICCLETFVHQAGRPQIPMTITRFSLPDDPELYLEPRPGDLPEGWDSLPSDKPSVDFGSQWLRDGKQMGLIVPSVVLPLERNVVINPAHPAVGSIEVLDIQNFRYDERMFKLNQS
ncbi:MAG TPA: RES domain-containing protein [Pseudomonas xinjiangensis]|uniref:RES domain-containing protein n=2 Tax=Pseudomonadales TaxID=72274 RepID=A0A7V1BL98_9GAMM|nr:RES domain-containing protein [Halopseudomonas xinjiangensis]HEA51684.1 RES domain-containing protein [Marinobacter antarcticus]